MWINFLMVSIGAVFGVLARMYAARWISTTWTHHFPLATFLINSTGSFALGIVTALHFGTWLSLLLTTGFLGTFTTFSTFNLENVELLRKKKQTLLLLYAGGTYVVGILAIFFGIAVGHLLNP